MSWATFDYVLLRGFLPICLLGSTVTRYNGFSFIYLIMLLICPFLRYNRNNIRMPVQVYLIILITVSGLFSLSISMFHVGLIFDPSFLSNCTNKFTSISHQIGITNLRGVLFYRVLRLVLPDYVILVISIVLLVYFRKCTLNDCQVLTNDTQSINDNHNNRILKEDKIKILENETPDSLLPGPSRPVKRLTEDTITTTSFIQQESEMVISDNNAEYHQARKMHDTHNYLHDTLGIDRLQKKIWRAWAMQSLFVFFNVVVTGFAGIISPSILNSVYLFGFLGICTFWACGNKVITTNFAYMRIFLLMYSAIHVCLLYLVQIEFVQYYLPNNNFSSRLLGLYYLIDTSCQSRGEVSFYPHRWIDYLSPCIIMYVYYLCATETRHWFEKGRESVPRVRSYKEDVKMSSLRQSNVHDPELQQLIPDKDTVSRTGSTLTSSAIKHVEYQTISKSNVIINTKPSGDVNSTAVDDSENQVNEDPLIIHDNDDGVKSSLIIPSTERPLLLSLINTAIRNSFVFTFIAMMAWSVTYKSWMSFILLLSACYLWMMPDSRKACLYMSPLIVLYATALIIIQYIYGFNLKELPETIDLSEIGLHKWEIPTGPLAVMTSFLVIFWLTLRLFMTDTLMNAPKKNELLNDSKFDQSSNADSEAYFGNVDNVIYKKIVSFLNGICEKYWILVCCFAMLFVSIQEPVVVFRIVYMLLLVYFLLTFMFSYSFWRKQMYVFWWFVIVYSVIVLLCIYTYQFKQFPYLWKNKTGLSEDILRDIGLQSYDAAALFKGLLTPVVFLVVIIVQVRYFHRPFLKLSSMNRFLYGDSREIGQYQDNLNVSTSSSSTSNVSAFIEDVNSAFQMVVEKLKQFFEVIYTKVWRLFECHFTKIVVFLIIYACINEVNAANIILVIIVVIGFPFPRLHSMLVTGSFFWCSLIVLIKMVYQLKTVNKFNWSTNCSAYTSSFNSSMDSIDNAKWIGLEKVINFQDHIWKWTAVLVVCAMWHAIKYHQRQYYKSPNSTKPESGIIFPETTVQSIDDSLINLFKFCVNFTFYKLGLELSFIVTVIVACLRVDVYSLVYLILLVIFLCTQRKVCSRMWLPYLLFLGVLLPIEYAICVGLPPGLCKKYPFSSFPNELQRWLYLPNYDNRPVAKKIMADFFQFVFVALQYRVFIIENSENVNIYGGGRNRPILCNELPKTIDKDFVSTKDSYVDYLKHAIFYWSYWLSLAIVFTTGVFWITLFCLGYMILAFIYLWMGQNIMLRKRSNLIASWNVIIYYNFFVILSKCTFQLIGCVYMDMVRARFCWMIPLFGVQCINPMSWDISIRTSTPNVGGTCSPVESGLHWDVTCFLFIILQRKIFMTKNFCHVVLDLNVQNRFASRGAYLINRKMMATIREQKSKEKSVLDKIKKKIDKIIQRQAQHGKPELNEHYLVVRSGDYYLFEGDPEEDDEEVENIDESSSKKITVTSEDSIDKNTSNNQYKKFSVDSLDFPGIMNDSSTIVINQSRNLLIPISENRFSTESSRKSLDNQNKIIVDNNENETKESDSSEEDDANPLQIQSTLNPLQLINRAMEQGPRSAVREFKRTQSESKENLPINRRSSVHLGSRLESMSEHDELSSLPEAYNTPPPHISETTTEDSFHSATVQDNSISNDHGLLNSEICTIHTPESEKYINPPVYRDTNISSNSMPELISKDDIDKKLIEKPIHPESCWSKFKASILFVYYFIQTTTDNLIILINCWTKEYRRIRRTLDNEKRLVKLKVLSKISNEMDGRIELEAIVVEIVGDGSHNVANSKNQEEYLKEQEFRRSRSRFFLLAISLGNVAIIYSEFVCYFLLILNHMLSGNLFSLPYPLMVFLWAMLSVPRPSKNFWIALITYTEIVIVIKYIFQFNFISFNYSNLPSDRVDPLWIPLIIGIEKSKNYAILDLIQLLFIFLHRGYLKNNGLWRDHTEFAQDLEFVDKEQDGKNKIKSSYDESSPASSNWSCNPIYKMRRFYSKMTNPKFNKKVDVYVYMFLCEFIAFLIIIFGYVSFGPGTDSADNAFDFIKTNKIPVPFITMIITQFVFIIIDRALFLRKQVKGKFIFQIFHVLLIHAWLFFALPHITKKKFNSQIAPQLFYFVKCIYFALSAYQMKSGYPLRILGNFLTRDFNYINLFLFKGYMIVPFLYELRNVMDWMWTDTSVALFHWMEVEDVFCKIFVLKCWRRSELEYPTVRGNTRRLAAKYSVGGLLLAFFFICFWGPLTLSSFISTTFVKNPPIECTFSISVGGYSPLFVFVSRENNLKSLPKDTFDKMKECYKNFTSPTDYLMSFEAGDVTQISIDGYSDDVWVITPPSLVKLKKKLTSPNESLKMNMQAICERRSSDSKTTEKMVRYTNTKKLSEYDKNNLSMVIETNNASILKINEIFPRFLTAYKRTLSEASPLIKGFPYTFLNLSLSMKKEKVAPVKWWEINETIQGETFCFDESAKPQNSSNLTIYIFSERVSDNLFGHLFSNYGIIGMYAAYIFVAHRVLRAFYSDISYIIRCEELPHVDRILNLLNEIYLVRENKMFRLEEQLIAKLIFLYRSSETMIKWTRHKKSILEKNMEKTKSDNPIGMGNNDKDILMSS